MGYEDGDLSYLEGKCVSVTNTHGMVAVGEYGEEDMVRNLGEGRIESGDLEDGVYKLKVASVSECDGGQILGLVYVRSRKLDGDPIQVVVSSDYSRSDWVFLNSVGV